MLAVTVPYRWLCRLALRVVSTRGTWESVMPRQLLHWRPGRARYQAGRTVIGLGEAVGAGAVRPGLLAVANGAARDACLSFWFAVGRP